jgi:hypothetical protein
MDFQPCKKLCITSHQMLRLGFFIGKFVRISYMIPLVQFDPASSYEREMNGESNGAASSSELNENKPLCD